MTDDTRYRQEFPGDEAGVRHARQWLAGHLDGHPQADDIELVAAELATNCIRHTASAGRTFAFVLEVEDDGETIRVAAEDLGSPDSKPERCKPTVDEMHGHGLCLVAEVADGWGCDGNEHGREVWAVWDAPAFKTATALGA